MPVAYDTAVRARSVAPQDMYDTVIDIARVAVSPQTRNPLAPLYDRQGVWRGAIEIARSDRYRLGMLALHCLEGLKRVAARKAQCEDKPLEFGVRRHSPRDPAT